MGFGALLQVSQENDISPLFPYGFDHPYVCGRSVGKDDCVRWNTLKQAAAEELDRRDLATKNKFLGKLNIHLIPSQTEQLPRLRAPLTPDCALPPTVLHFEGLPRA
jgi:hypothetical protein